MLSRIDIERELGENINIFPFNYNNFKENSINLCAGYYAWTLGTKTIYFNLKNKKFTLNKNDDTDKPVRLKKGDSAIYKVNKNEQYIILLPQSTTLIETKEVLAVGNNIGGTYHSKVGLVSQGIGHVGTMLGPNFSGYSLISLHNSTEKICVLKVGESFVSVVFHYLNTPIIERNATVSGHIDKMSELGIKLKENERKALTADWTSKISEVKKKMINSENYKRFLVEKKKDKFRILKKYINKTNIYIVVGLMAFLFLLGWLANYLDNIYNCNIYIAMYRTMITSGIFVTIISNIIKCIKPR